VKKIFLSKEYNRIKNFRSVIDQEKDIQHLPEIYNFNNISALSMIMSNSGKNFCNKKE